MGGAVEGTADGTAAPAKIRWENLGQRTRRRDSSGAGRSGSNWLSSFAFDGSPSLTPGRSTGRSPPASPCAAAPSAPPTAAPSAFASARPLRADDAAPSAFKSARPLRIEPNEDEVAEASRCDTTHSGAADGAANGADQRPPLAPVTQGDLGEISALDAFAYEKPRAAKRHAAGSTLSAGRRARGGAPTSACDSIRRAMGLDGLPGAPGLPGLPGRGRGA